MFDWAFQFVQESAVTLETLSPIAGKTDANGFVALNCYISWDYDPDLIDMMAYVSSSDYTTIQCSGNYTTTGNTLYPEFWVKKDLDQTYMHHVGLNKSHFLLQKIFPQVDPFGHFRQLRAGAQLVGTYDPKRKYLGQIVNVIRPIIFLV